MPETLAGAPLGHLLITSWNCEVPSTLPRSSNNTSEESSECGGAGSLLSQDATGYLSIFEFAGEQGVSILSITEAEIRWPLAAHSTIGGNVFLMDSVDPHSLVIYDGLDMRVLAKQEKAEASDFDI